MQEFTPYEYMLIDIANHYGDLDKLQYEDRIVWVDQHMDHLEDMVNDVGKNAPLFMAAVLALRDVQNGVPTGHLVGFDACASGLQIFATFTGCHTTAKNTGLIGSRRMDMYTECTVAMSRILGVQVPVTRKQVKEAQMPYFYGSKALPKELFGEDTPELAAFYKANQEVAPGACEALQILLMSWQPYAMDHSWDMPDGFHIYCPVMIPTDSKIEVQELGGATFVYRHEINCGTEKGLSLAANSVHAVDGMVVREMSRRCNYTADALMNVAFNIEFVLSGNRSKPANVHCIEQLWQDSGFLSLVAIEYLHYVPNLRAFSTEYLTAVLALIMKVLDRPSHPLISIHDNFKAHPNYVGNVRYWYAEIMAELAESNIFSFLLTQINKKPIQVNKYSNNLGQLIRQGNYALS